jgi:hypothetical protein
MNKLYDKLLLALAVIALLAGIGIYLTSGSAADTGVSQVTFSQDDSPYVSLPRPESAGVEAEWPEAVEQAPGEFFDVFTPPAIYIDNKNGNFVFKAPNTSPPPPFGVYLASVERKPYRLQLEGYIEEDLNDASKSLLLFADEEVGASIRARVGQEKPDSQFIVNSFEITRVRDEDNLINKIAKATIKDLRTDETVILTNGETLYLDELVVTIRSNQNPEVNVELTEAGQTFETPAGTYTLLEINLEENSISVEKDGTDDREPEVETLQEQTTAPINNTPEDITTDGNSANGSSGLFDFNF